MTVTWTSGYDINEAVPFVEWGLKGDLQTRSPAGTLTFFQSDMCGEIHLVPCLVANAFLPISSYFLILAVIMLRST